MYVQPTLLSHIMGYHGNHQSSCNQNAFIFKDNIFLNLSGPIEQIYIPSKMSCVSYVGLITP